jgi:hypothetical protein
MPGGNLRAMPGGNLRAMPGGNLRAMPGGNLRARPLVGNSSQNPGYFQPGASGNPSQNLGVLPNIQPGTSSGRLSSAGAAYYGGSYYGPTSNPYYGSVPYVRDAGSDACDLVRVRKPTPNGGYRYVVVRQCELSQAR